jgi:transcriptional regulator with XRE-family HTH domain
VSKGSENGLESPPPTEDGPAPRTSSSYDPVVLGKKLRHLRETVPKPGGGLYTQDDLAKSVAEKTGKTCTRQYISELEAGAKPSGLMLDKLAAIAATYGVPPSYFFDDPASEAINAQMGLILRLAKASEDDTTRMLLRRISTMAREDVPKLIAALESLDQPATTPAASPAVQAQGTKPEVGRTLFRAPGQETSD